MKKAGTAPQRESFFYTSSIHSRHPEKGDSQSHVFDNSKPCSFLSVFSYFYPLSANGLFLALDSERACSRQTGDEK